MHSSRFVFYRHGCHRKKTKKQKRSLPHQWFYSSIWPGMRCNKWAPKHKVADRMRLYYPGKNFSGGKEEKLEMLGQFIAIHRHQQSIHILLSFLLNLLGITQGIDCTRTEIILFGDENIEMWDWHVSKEEAKMSSFQLGAKVVQKLSWPEWTQFLFLSTLRNRTNSSFCVARNNRQAATLRQIYDEPGPGCFLLKEIYDFNKCSY